MPESDRVVCRVIRASVVQPTRRICVHRSLKARQFLRRLDDGRICKLVGPEQAIAALPPAETTERSLG